MGRVKAGSGGKAEGVAKTVDELFGTGGMDAPFEDESELEELSDDETEGEDEDQEAEEDDARSWWVRWR